MDVGVRKLYLEGSGSGLRIVGDEFLPARSLVDGGGSVHPLLASGEVLEGKLRKAAALAAAEEREKKLSNFVGRWANAWQSGDMEAYGGCYSANFQSLGMDKSEWVERKRRLGRKYDYIKVSLSRIKVEEKKGRAVVSFVQDYISSAFRAKGRKKLLLELEDGEWKIYSEIWKKS